MKKLTVFETGIIGLLIGVAVSAYLTFIIGNNGFVGQIISWLSLRPLLRMVYIPDNQTLLAGFIFFVLVYTIYGVIVGMIINNFNKSKLLIIPAALLIAGIVFEQQTGSAHFVVVNPEDAYLQTANALQAMPILHPTPKTPQQYFGNETLGDLNGDSKDDVAFIIHRDDPERGTLYYVTAAISSDAGRTGTNLLFLGDKVKPQTIGIESSTVVIEYTQNTSTTTEKFFAQVIKGNLEKIKTPTVATTSAAAPEQSPSL